MTTRCLAWPVTRATVCSLLSWRCDVLLFLSLLTVLHGPTSAADEPDNTYRPDLLDGQLAIFDSHDALVGQIVPFSDEAVQAEDVLTAETHNRFCWRRTFSLKPDLAQRPVRLTMDFRAAHRARFTMIPGISWNGNLDDPGNVVQGFAVDGIPWSFASHRTLIPAGTYSEGERHAVGMWAEVSDPEAGLSCSLIPADESTLHRLIVPEEERPQRILIRERGWSEGCAKEFILRAGHSVTVTAWLVLQPVQRPRISYHSFLDAAWIRAYKPTFAQRSTDELWSLGIRFIKESLWDEQAKMFHLAMAYDEAQQKWVRAGGFSLGWCGRNGELANALLEDFLRFGDRTSLEMGLSCLDKWANKVPEELDTAVPGACVEASPMARYLGLAADANTLSDGATAFLCASELIKRCNEERPAYRHLGLGICDAALTMQKPDGRFEGPGCERGAIGAAFIPPLLTAWELTGEDKYLVGARSALGFYMEVLYRDGYLWGGALDTRSIDKETVLPLLVGAVRLYEHTDESACLAHAVDAAYYLAAWQIAQSIPNVPGSLMESIGFETFGGTSVATVHMCADPFGVSTVPYLLRLAHHTKQDTWAQRAQALWNNASQGISTGTLVLHGLPPRPCGSQDETVNYTDWGYDYLAQGMDRNRPRGAGQGWLTAWPTAMRLTILADPDLRQQIAIWPVQAVSQAQSERPQLPDSCSQYILLNRAPGQGMYQGQPETLGRKRFEEVLAALPNRPEARIQTGLSYVFSCFRTPPETTVAALRTFLQASEETNTPVLVQMDTEHWWDARPDLWNWWDPQQPGFDPANRENVEWTDWSADSALKIAWRNWGQQIRVLPPPNLASPRYVAACQQEIRRLVPVILDWHAQLPDDKKHLLVGIKLGHETSIGVNAYHYPNGNELLTRPASADPSRMLNTDDVLARGVAQIGFAALKTSGIRSQGVPTESELRDVAQRYLESLCQVAAEAGVPRHLLFTHGAGWKSDELMYDVPVNPFACPGWSFYLHAADPRRDSGVQRNLARSDAPYWAATEWLLQGTYETSAWRTAIDNTLADSRCRYLCVFNWESICQQPTVLQAISETTADSVPKECGCGPYDAAFRALGLTPSEVPGEK